MTAPTPRSYGDDAIHRPPKYGEGDTEARRNAAIARARAERPDHPRPYRTPTGPELTERALAQLDHRTATRTGDPTGPDRADLDKRLAEQQRRRDAAHALVPLAEHFEDYLGAQLGDVPEVVEWADDAAAGSASWLVILGNTGVGKTWQAAAAYRAVTHDRGLDGTAITATDLFLRSLPSAPDRLNLRAYERAPVLLLDDLTGDLSDWDRKILFQLLDARSAGNRLTILTSNLRREEVKERLGDRIASRLSHRLRLVGIEGPDRRTTPRD
jgi:chromosomal replication initiation ATPase DnaA